MDDDRSVYEMFGIPSPLTLPLQQQSSLKNPNSLDPATVGGPRVDVPADRICSRECRCRCAVDAWCTCAHLYRLNRC